jgi:predicted transcriptional regulator
MVFEMTGDYHNILPVMFSVAIADLVAEKLNHAPIYSTLILKQDTPSKEKTILTKIMVTDAMDTSITKIGLDTKIKDVINLIKEEYYDVLPIMDKKGNLVGTISKDDLEDYTLRESNPNANIETIMNPEPIYINQEDDLYKALFILHSNGIKDIIVISRNKQIKGVLSRKQIMQKLRYSNLTK